MYRLPAAAASGCVLHYDGSAITLEYRFADGAWLRARRDDAIEYSDLELHLIRPLGVDPLSMLQPAEHDAFGARGCGIDWQHPEVEAMPDGTNDQIYRGELCNCQGRVRHDARGGIVGLVFRSTC